MLEIELFKMIGARYFWNQMRWLFALFISLMVSDLIGSDSSEIEERKLIGGRYVFMQSGFPVEKKTLQYQNLNGVQLKQKETITLGVQYAL